MLCILQIKFESFGTKQGPLHGLPISTPYVTKDYLQLKRFQAQTAGTTYCYDFPEMFRQMTERLWKEYIEERPDQNIQMPEQIMDYVELVMENEDTLVEQKRIPGENNVSFLGFIFVCLISHFSLFIFQLILFSVGWHGCMALNNVHS